MTPTQAAIPIPITISSEFGQRIGHPLTREEWVAARREAMTAVAGNAGTGAAHRRAGADRHLHQQRPAHQSHHHGPVSGCRRCLQRALSAPSSSAPRSPTRRASAKLMERMGTEPSRCWFIDDKRSNVKGARMAGLRGHHFRELPAASCPKSANWGLTHERAGRDNSGPLHRGLDHAPCGGDDAHRRARPDVAVPRRPGRPVLPVDAEPDGGDGGHRLCRHHRVQQSLGLDRHRHRRGSTGGAQSRRGRCGSRQAICHQRAALLAASSPRSSRLRLPQALARSCRCSARMARRSGWRRPSSGR